MFTRSYSANCVDFKYFNCVTLHSNSNKRLPARIFCLIIRQLVTKRADSNVNLMQFLKFNSVVTVYTRTPFIVAVKFVKIEALFQADHPVDDWHSLGPFPQPTPPPPILTHIHHHQYSSPLEGTRLAPYIQIRTLSLLKTFLHPYIYRYIYI